MLDHVGRYFALKVGLADEKIQFRRLIRKDKELHEQLRKEIDLDNTIRRKDGPDNWLIAREWYLRSEGLVESIGKGPRTGEIMYYMNIPKQKRNYARDIQVEFAPDESSRLAWGEALKDWQAYGAKPMRSARGWLLQLNNSAKEKSKDG